VSIVTLPPPVFIAAVELMPRPALKTSGSVPSVEVEVISAFTAISRTASRVRVAFLPFVLPMATPTFRSPSPV
jgi:hypothetical protein